MKFIQNFFKRLFAPDVLVLEARLQIADGNTAFWHAQAESYLAALEAKIEQNKRDCDRYRIREESLLDRILYIQKIAPVEVPEAEEPVNTKAAIPDPYHGLSKEDYQTILDRAYYIVGNKLGKDEPTPDEVKETLEAMLADPQTWLTN